MIWKIMNSDEWEKIDNCINSILKNNKINIEQGDHLKNEKQLVYGFINSMKKRRLIEEYLDKLFYMELFGFEYYLNEKNGNLKNYE